MCSISGFVASKPLRRDYAIRLARGLLYFGRDRGKQSAGAWVDGRVLKRALDPDEFGWLPEFGELFPDEGVTQALLHTRQPTCGEMGDEQAQPFMTDSVATVHNGVISNMVALQERWGIDMPSGVDSELVTSFVRKFGPFKLPRFIRKMNGSAAIALHWRGHIYLMRESNPIETYTVRLADDTDVTVFGSTQTIVERSIRYVWLVTSYISTKTLREGRLHRIEPDKEKTIRPIGPIIQYRYTGRRYYQGVHDAYDDGFGYYRKENDAPTAPKAITAPPQQPLEAKPEPKETKRQRRERKLRERYIGTGYQTQPHHVADCRCMECMDIKAWMACRGTDHPAGCLCMQCLRDRYRRA